MTCRVSRHPFFMRKVWDALDQGYPDLAKHYMRKAAKEMSGYPANDNDNDPHHGRPCDVEPDGAA